MPIEIKRFGGMFPKLDSESLPESAAELAQNVTIHTGALVPSATLPEPLDSIGTVSSGVVADVYEVRPDELDALDIAEVMAPWTPRFNSLTWKCPNDLSWLTIKAVRYFVTTEDEGVFTGQVVDAVPDIKTCAIESVSRTPTGLVLGIRIPNSRTWPTQPGKVYRSIGPLFAFQLAGRVTEDGDGAVTTTPYYLDARGGGPYNSIDLPSSAGPSYGDDVLPPQRVPLEWGTSSNDYHGEVYGYFQAVDYRGADNNMNVDTTEEEAASTFQQFGGFGYIEINLNYVENRYRTFYYKMSRWVNVADTDQASKTNWHDSRASSDTLKAIVPPGSLPKLDVRLDMANYIANPWKYKYAIYRSETTARDFRFVEFFRPSGTAADLEVEYEDAEYAWLRWEDTMQVATDEMPVQGRIGPPPEMTIWHPAGFAVGWWPRSVSCPYFDPEDPDLSPMLYNLHRSDLYRPWCWPDENAVPFQEPVDFAVMSGNTVLVFTKSHVYAVSGNDPEYGTKVLLSSSLPALNTFSIARIGDRVYYSTLDGLVEATGGGCRLVTGEYFDRETWEAFGMTTRDAYRASDYLQDNVTVTYATRVIPGYNDDTDEDTLRWTQAKVGDGRLFYGPLVFDFEEGAAAVSVYKAGESSLWRSKVFVYDQPTTMDYGQIMTDDAAAVTATLYADGVAVATLTQDTYGQPGAWKAVVYNVDEDGVEQRVWARRWQVEIDVATTVKSITIADRQVMEAQDVTRLTGEQVPAWKNIWLRWPHRGRWCAGALKQQEDRDVWITFTPQDRSSTAVTIRTDGQQAFYLPRTVPKDPDNPGLGSTPVPEDAYWNVMVNSPFRFDELILWRRTRESVDGALRAVNDGPVPPWRVKTYVFAGKDLPGSLTVQSNTVSKVSVNVYVDGATTPTTFENVVPGTALRLADLGAFHELELDFGTKDDDITEVILTTAASQPVGEGGLVMTEQGEWVGKQFRFADLGNWAIASAWFENVDDTGTLKLYKDGGSTPTHELYLTSNRPVYIPWDPDDAGCVWEVVLETSAMVRRLELVPWTRRMLEGGTLSLTTPGGAYPPWRHTIFQWPERRTFRSLWVDAVDIDEKVKVWFYRDDEIIPSKRYDATPAVEAPLGGDNWAPICESFRVSFDAGDEDRVTYLRLNSIDPVQAGAEGLQMTRPGSWRGHQVVTPGSVQWACGILTADDYTNMCVTLSVAGTTRRVEQPITNSVFSIHRTAGMSAAWDLDVYRTQESTMDPRPEAPTALQLLPWRDVPVEGGVVRTTRQGPMVPPWRFTRYVFTDAQCLKSIKVNASAAVTVSLYLDGASTAAWSGTVQPGVETVLPTTLPDCSRVDFDFSDHDVVDEVLLFTVDEQVVGPEGLTMRNPLSTRMLPVKFPSGGSFAAVSVGAGSYPVTVTQYSGTTVVSTTPLNSGEAQGIGHVADYTQGAVDIEGTDIRSVVLLPWRRQVVEGGIFDVRSEGGIAPWVYTQYGFTDSKQLVAMRVATETEGLRVVIHGLADKTIAIVKGRDVAFSTTEREALRGQWFRWYFVDKNSNRADHLVSSVTLYSEVVIPVGPEGLVLRQGEQVPTWRNVRLRFPDAGRFSVIRVICTRPANVTLSCWGQTQYTRSNIPSGVDYVITDQTVGQDWTLDIETEGRVDEVHLIGDVDVPVEQGSAVVRRQQAPFSWLSRRIVAPDPVSFSAMRVIASEYPVTVTLYADDATSTTQTVPVEDGKAFRIARKGPARRWRVSVAADSDVLVREVGLATSMGRLKA